MDWFGQSKVAQGASLDQAIKLKVRSSPFFAKMFKHFGKNPADVKWVRFSVGDLQGDEARSKGDEIILDHRVAQQPLDVVMHRVAHELSHWLTRKREETHYFSDPEEVEGFEWGIAHELSRGADLGQIEEQFLPTIEAHSPDAGEARKLFMRMVMRAKRMT